MIMFEGIHPVTNSTIEIRIKDNRTETKTIVQQMLYNRGDDRRSLTILSPEHQDLDPMVVVMHAHTDGYWHSAALNLVNNYGFSQQIIIELLSTIF